jgi:Mn2+/Fe2+ NRAMP family transporter
MMDFRIGYWGTAFLAACFVGLGSMIVYGTGETMPSSGTAFAGKLIELYTESLGSWSYWLIGIAAFTTMFSTTLTVLDAYPRVLGAASARLTGVSKEGSSASYLFWLLFTIAGTMIILIFFLSSMTALIDLVTTISFILAPLFAIMNYLVIMGRNVPKKARPGLITHFVSWLGIGFNLLLAGYYLFAQYFA